MSTINFNDEQLQIIDQVQGGLLVLAPVGTGKTSVLSARVTQAIAAGLAPNRILCLTFTNRAAKEMSDRVAISQPEIHRQLTIKTFHGLCARMLRIEAEAIGLPSDFAIYDDQDCFTILKSLSKLDKDQEVWDLLNEIADCKSKAIPAELTLELTLESLFANLDSTAQQIAVRYQQELSDRHALDFSDLVFYTRAMLHCNQEIAERWRDRFDFVQVDEVQDTHIGEYEVVRHLAIKSGNLALIGDLDQTIYSWRGSEPDVVLNQFKLDFQPCSFSLTENYRATQTLLQAASAFADEFDERHTAISPAAECEVGEKILIHHAIDETQEAQWIARQIRTLSASSPNFRYNRVAVLTRTHNRTRFVASALKQVNVPSVTVDQYQFFLRQEIKDALAYLHFIVNPFDTGAFKRLVLTPLRGIGLQTLRAVYREGKQCGFRLTDLAAPQPFTNDDPLGAIVDAHAHRTIVVFDVETTGVAVGDEIVEIAAVKLVRGQPVARFQAYISDAADVGESQHIHGYSDEFLQRNGRPAREVLAEFCQFAGTALLVGHNVGFDIKMVTAHAQKKGLMVPQWQWADTWNLAHRFIKAESYSLENLAAQLNLPTQPNHQAMDDVLTTVELLARLIPLVAQQAGDRVALYYKYGEVFGPLAEAIAEWKMLSQQLRPADLLIKILHDSGLARHYAAESDRSQNLSRLIDMFRQKDDPQLHPDTALRSLLEFTALAKNLDHLSEQDNQVVIITAHQSKGLEFDHVFIAGMSEGEFPSFHSLRDDDTEEEKRLFYVALTRAKKRLHVSCFQQNGWGNKAPSQFLHCLPDAFYQEI